MTPDIWIAIFTGLGVMVALTSGFGFWMFRIDRAVTRIEVLAGNYSEFRRDSLADRIGLRERITVLETLEKSKRGNA